MLRVSVKINNVKTSQGLNSCLLFGQATQNFLACAGQVNEGWSVPLDPLI